MSSIQSALIVWLVAALAHWAPAPPGTLHDAVVEEQTIVATALVDVAFDPSEPPLRMFGASPDARARTALLLGSIAAHESRLLPRLAAGECRRYECDGGAATSLMQLHLGTYGVELLPSAGFRYCDSHSEGCVTAKALAGNESLQMRTALHWLRQGGLGRYTGEGDADAPAARRRRVAAELWAMRHPPPRIDG